MMWQIEGAFTLGRLLWFLTTLSSSLVVCDVMTIHQIKWGTPGRSIHHPGPGRGKVVRFEVTATTTLLLGEGGKRERLRFRDQIRSE